MRRSSALIFGLLLALAGLGSDGLALPLHRGFGHGPDGPAAAADAQLVKSCSLCEHFASQRRAGLPRVVPALCVTLAPAAPPSLAPRPALRPALRSALRSRAPPSA